MPGIKSSDIEYGANGERGSGYLARPDDGDTHGAPHPGVIVIQEWWGLDAHIRDVADRFAREGFVALAPDLYHGKTASEPDEARKLAMNLNRERAAADLAGAVRYLLDLPNVAPKKAGCIGFCMGGSMTLITQARPRYTPCQTKPVIHQGAPYDSYQRAAASSIANSASANMAEGTFAPRIVK